MADVPQVTNKEPSELLAAGRRHLVVRDFSNATSTLAEACELLAAKHGDTADECGEAYLWYGKALLGLAREESGVLGDGIAPGGEANNDEDEDDDDVDDEGNDESCSVKNGDKESAENEADSSEQKKMEKSEESKDDEKSKEITKDDPQEDVSSTVDEQPGPSNGNANGEEVADLDEDEVENLQLAWEMLDLARGIIAKRLEKKPTDDLAKSLLAEIHLSLGEVALESETYDKAVADMQKCLEIQKHMYRTDDRRIAETHYQIALAHSLSSNFEEAITHFKNAANILETRIKTLENPSSATDDPTVKKYQGNDPFYSVSGEIKELKELLPEIQEKIQDMMEYKAEVRPCDCIEETRNMLRELMVQERNRELVKA